MKFISNYEEFGAKNGISVKDHISLQELPEKRLVLEYLKQGTQDGVVCASIYDYIKEKSLRGTIKSYTDGIYYWTDEEVYHFEKYNMEIEEAFVRHVIGES